MTPAITGKHFDDMPALAPLRKRLGELASRNIFVGTSSWKYEGWLGQLYSPERYEYRGKIAKTRFEAECLSEYAETFRTVCVDAGFYRFPEEKYISNLASQVPDGFLLSFKATDEITIKHFPNQQRHGERAGKPNENFLNAELFADSFLGPMSPYREKIGVIMFEFSRFYSSDFERGRHFVAALDVFLGRLPKGWQFGVELRNPGFLKPDYFAMLRNHGVTHVFNAWTQMPTVNEQIALEGSFTADFFASRFLLRKGRAYQAAVEAFSPYSEVKDVNPEARDAIKSLAQRSSKRPSSIFVNNRLEGNALKTITETLCNSDVPN